MSEYAENIHRTTKVLDAEDLAQYVEQALSSTPDLIEEEARSQIVGQLGDRRFHISVLKLMSGLAGIGKTLMDHSHPTIFVGLSVIAAISSLVESVRSISLDEAAVCQAMYELKTETNLLTFSRAAVSDRFAKLAETQTDLDSRFATALESLGRLRVVAVESAKSEVKLLDLVFFKKRASPSRARSAAA